MVYHRTVYPRENTEKPIPMASQRVRTCSSAPTHRNCRFASQIKGNIRYVSWSNIRRM